jgi:hypothetical protein
MATTINVFSTEKAHYRPAIPRGERTGMASYCERLRA